ncbi:MFS transporter [Streptosporangium sp. NPDC001559]|uniref:MFS transporter n=1 Tax=Streptosporangium sp. NPDC001559 TaxID=3366187 RepID=UPI0036E40874
MTSTVPAAPVRDRWGLLAVLSGNMLIDALEVSVAIVALPAIGHDLRVDDAVAQWVVGGFALGFGGLLVAGRRAVARWGERRVYLVALLVFAVVSAVGAAATSIAVLVLARVVKGACVALTAPTGLAVIGRAFPEGEARNRAISVYSSFGACGFSAGLLLSGLVTQVDWRWTFLFPAPVALVLFLFGVRLIPGRAGDTSVPAGGRGLPVSRGLLRSALGAAALNGSFWGLLVTCTFRLQDGLGWTPLQAGVALLPASLPVALTAPFSGRLVGRFGTRGPIALGAALLPIGYLSVWRFRGDRPDLLTEYAVGVLPALLIVGGGFALCFSALHMQALSGLRAAEHGMATALYQSAVQLGGVLVLALVTVPAFSPLGVVTAVGLLGFLVALTGIIAERRTL